MSIERLYLRCPQPVQALIVNLQGWRIQRRRYGTGFAAVRRRVEEQGCLSKDEIRAFQSERMREFLRCAQTATHWREMFQRCDLNIDSHDIFSEYHKLPLLTKQTVREDPSRFLTNNTPRSELVRSHTSGTTGSALIFPTTRHCEQMQWATWWRYRQWHGIEVDTWCGYFGGRSLLPIHRSRPPYWLVNHAAHQVMFSGHHLSNRTAGSYIDELARRKLPWLHGYPSMLSLLAAHKRDQGLADLPDLRIITTGSESLLPQQRFLLETIFNVPVREHYGLAEATSNISECLRGRLHVDEDFAYTELGSMGENSTSRQLIGTNWNNAAFPLVRYNAGDDVTIVEADCNCGQTGRLISAIDGRKEDYVLLPSGVKVTRLDHIFKDMIEIREAQVYQSQTGEVFLRIVQGRGYDRRIHEDRLIAEARQRLGDQVPLAVHYFDSLPRTTNGKLRLVVSKVVANTLR